MTSTRDRIMHRLAEMAAEDQTSGFGAMIQAAYALGFDGLIATAIPEDDGQADALLEAFAQMVLDLRSDAAREARPFLSESEFAQLLETEIDTTPALVTAGDELPPAVPFVDPEL